MTDKDKTLTRKILTEKTVKYPKKHWCLYFNEGEELRPFDGTIGRQDKELENGMVELTIVGKLGYRERDHVQIGAVITVQKEKLALGYLPREHMDELYARIKIIEPNPYVESNRDVWLLETVAGFYRTIKAVTENKGVLNTKLIEELFDAEEITYCLSNNLLFYNTDSLTKNKYAERYTIEELTSLEALKRYGLVALEEVAEKTCCGVGSLNKKIG